MTDEQLHDIVSRTNQATRNTQHVIAENERLLSRSREVLKQASDALAKAQAIVRGSV